MAKISPPPLELVRVERQKVLLSSLVQLITINFFNNFPMIACCKNAKWNQKVFMHYLHCNFGLFPSRLFSSAYF